jgi:hypothetical protein
MIATRRITLREKFHTHIAEQLIAQCERLAVCVVK